MKDRSLISEMLSVGSAFSNGSIPAEVVFITISKSNEFTVVLILNPLTFIISSARESAFSFVRLSTVIADAPLSIRRRTCNAACADYKNITALYCNIILFEHHTKSVRIGIVAI